jgi:hypothetical protein
LNTLFKLITQLVEAAGKTEAFATEEEFSLQLIQTPFDPLEIRSWRARDSYFGEKRHISLAHQCSIPEGFQMTFLDPQDKYLDPEVVMTEHGIPIGLYYATKTIPIVTILSSGNTLVYTHARRMAEQFMEEWARNITAQDWLSIAREFGEVHKIIEQEEITHGE